MVDYFVITECAVTHQNASKPLFYAENAQRFARFRDKVIHVALDSLEGPSSYFRCSDAVAPGCHAGLCHRERPAACHAPVRCRGACLRGHARKRREWDHREHLFKEGLHAEGREARHGDLIISGDVDEIPKAAAVAALRRCEWPRLPEHHYCAALEGSFFYFSYANYAGHLDHTPSSLQLLALTGRCTREQPLHACVGEWSAGPKAFVYEGDATMGGLDKNLMRYETKCDLFLKGASWHCTDCFATLAAVRAKVASFSHWEKNR